MINHNLQQVLLGVAILTASSGVMTKEISYNFIQGTYISTSVDSGTTSGDVDGNGFGVAGSFSIAPHIAITAGFGATSFDTFLGIDIDTTELTLGVTGYASIASGTSIFGNFSILKGDVEATDGFITVDDDDTGNVISVGLRHLVTDAVELNLGLSRVDIFDDTENSYGFGARFYANEKVSLGIGYSTSSDVDTLSLNIRIDI